MMLEILNNSEESDYCDPFLSKMTYSQKFVVKSQVAWCMLLFPLTYGVASSAVKHFVKQEM
jgi:hypothetical protein